MTFFVAMVRQLSTACGIAAVVLLLAAVLVVCHLVFDRYVLNVSAIWQHEFVTFSLIGATFLGSPYVLLTRGHVNVDLLPSYLRPRARLALAVFAALVSLSFTLLVTWYGVIWWYEAWAAGWRGDTVWAPPLWVPYLSMPLGMGQLSLQYVADLVALCGGRTSPFGTGPASTS